MITKFRLILISAFEKFCKLFHGTGIGKIPGVRAIYRFLQELPGLFWLWPEEKIIQIQGFKMYVNVHDKCLSMRRTFRNYALTLVHEEATTDLFKKVVKEENIVLDLGANIGYFTLLAAKLVGKKGKVYSFEPEPRNYNYLVKNIELNGYDNVFAIQKAASDKTGKTKLYICPYDSGHHTINQYGGIKAYNPDFIDDKKDFVEVETVTLDDFFKDKKQGIDVIKMDVEGAEMLVLSGMDKVIKQNENLKMFIEFFPLLIREMGSSPDEFIRRLLDDYRFSMFIVGLDYCMRDYSLDKEYLKINNVDQLMNLCESKQFHVNLFLKKGENQNKPT